MKSLFGVIPVIIVFLSCAGRSNKHAADENRLSLLIFHNSVIVYNGNFDNNTSYKKYLANEFNKLSKVIEEHRGKYSSRSEILLKIASADGAGLSDIMQNLSDISEKNNGPDLTIADVTETEAQFFSIFLFKKSYLDSLRKPIALDLNMPMAEDRPMTKINERLTFTCLIIFEDSIYCYRGADLSSGSFYSLKDGNSFRTRLKRIKRETGDSLIVILKPAETATYKNTVDVLDEMTINHIKKYTMVKLTDKERSFLQIKYNIK